MTGRIIRWLRPNAAQLGVALAVAVALVASVAIFAAPSTGKDFVYIEKPKPGWTVANRFPVTVTAKPKKGRTSFKLQVRIDNKIVITRDKTFPATNGKKKFVYRFRKTSHPAVPAGNHKIYARIQSGGKTVAQAGGFTFKVKQNQPPAPDENLPEITEIDDPGISEEPPDPEIEPPPPPPPPEPEIEPPPPPPPPPVVVDPPDPRPVVVEPPEETLERDVPAARPAPAPAPENEAAEDEPATESAATDDDSVEPDQPVETSTPIGAPLAQAPDDAPEGAGDNQGEPVTEEEWNGDAEVAGSSGQLPVWAQALLIIGLLGAILGGAYLGFRYYQNHVA